MNNFERRRSFSCSAYPGELEFELDPANRALTFIAAADMRLNLRHSNDAEYHFQKLQPMRERETSYHHAQTESFPNWPFGSTYWKN